MAKNRKTTTRETAASARTTVDTADPGEAESPRELESPGSQRRWDAAALRRGVSTILPALLVAAIVLPVRSAIADWNDVPSGSMWPTILVGDRIYVNKLAYGLRVPFTNAWISTWDEPKRGDIVTFASPEDGIRLVKRVIGVPGDRIAMRENTLSVNGEPVGYSEIGYESYTLPNGAKLELRVADEELPGHTHQVAFVQAVLAQSSFAELTVPPGSFFFLGDNRDQSRDSRFLGLAKRDDLYGRVTAVALSVDPERSYRPRFERWFTSIR